MPKIIYMILLLLHKDENLEHNFVSIPINQLISNWIELAWMKAYNKFEMNNEKIHCVMKYSSSFFENLLKKPYHVCNKARFQHCKNFIKTYPNLTLNYTELLLSRGIFLDWKVVHI